MKHIEFRGISKETNKFVFGYLSSNGEDFFIGNHGENYRFDEVIKESIGQFTGLHDKNGVEIYEGDVLSEKYKVLVYQDITGAFMIRFLVCPETNYGRSLLQYLKDRQKAATQERDCVIIGNIYQNPELLK